MYADTPSDRRYNLLLLPVWAGFTNVQRTEYRKENRVTLHEVWQLHLKQVIKVTITNNSHVNIKWWYKKATSPLWYSSKSITPVQTWENITQTQIKGHSTKYLANSLQKYQDLEKQAEWKTDTDTHCYCSQRTL